MCFVASIAGACKDRKSEWFANSSKETGVEPFLVISDACSPGS